MTVLGQFESAGGLDLSPLNLPDLDGAENVPVLVEINLASGTPVVNVLAVPYERKGPCDPFRPGAYDLARGIGDGAQGVTD